jgi:hypothetical protein
MIDLVDNDLPGILRIQTPFFNLNITPKMFFLDLYRFIFCRAIQVFHSSDGSEYYPIHIGAQQALYHVGKLYSNIKHSDQSSAAIDK